MIKADPADNGAEDKVKGDVEAKADINIIHMRLKNGSDFATLARESSEDRETSLRGGDAGFFSEEQLRETGFPPGLVRRFLSSMQVGDFTEPVLIKGAWYIFKLQSRREQAENLTLDSPAVRSQITEALVNQRKEVINAGLVQTALNGAKVVNYLAAKARTQ